MLTFQSAILKSLGPLAVAAFALASPAIAHPSIDIVAANWHFTPSTINVEAGQTTTLRLTSTSGTHGIASNELGIAPTTIVPGRFVEVSFTPRVAGTYAVHCSIYCGAGHPDMVLTVIVNGATVIPPAPTAMPQPAATSTPTPRPAPTRTPTPLIDDRHFIVLMVYHERMGLQMAQFAMKSARRSEIRSMAKSLVARNSAAIAQLQKWYKVWYGASVPDMPSMAATRSQSMAQICADAIRATSPGSLSNAPDVDRAWLVDSIHHESMGASVSLMAEEGLTHPELRRFARSGASIQLNDVQQIWRWFKRWYAER